MANGKPKLNAHDGNSAQKQFSTILALVVTGVGIGWLAGLSVSPVISVVITSVIGVAAAVVTALSGLKQESSKTEPLKALTFRVEVWPLAILVIALVVGSGLGIVARNHHLFGSDIDSEIAKWQRVDVPKEAVMERLFGSTATYSPYTEPVTDTLQLEVDRWVSLGIDKVQVVNKLFEQQFFRSAAQTATSPLAADNRNGTHLYAAASQAECDAWQKLVDKENYEELARQVSTSEVIPFRQLPVIVTDPVKLATIVEEVLCAATQQ